MGSGCKSTKDMLAYEMKVRRKAIVAVSLNNRLQKDYFYNFCNHGMFIFSYIPAFAVLFLH